jgi:tRNA 2-selenouridine synthase
MTLIPDSPKNGSQGGSAGPAHGSYAPIESLAGAFHPHAIEIQDFPYYGQVIDLRSASEYADDHIPGAVRLDADARAATPMMTGPVAQVPPPLTAQEPSWLALPASQLASLAAAVAHVRLDQAILVYCGQGGLVSTTVAQALRWRGWTVDVLPGGWVNYRRWVVAGLEVLPRLIQFRVLACTLGSESARVLAALRSAGHQVLDLEALAGKRRFALTALTGAATPKPQEAHQPAQAWFDSQLLQALRATDPSMPVWVADTGPHLGAITLPGALNDALALAPAAALQADMAARASAWAEDEPACADAQPLIPAVVSLSGEPAEVIMGKWRELASQGSTSLLLASLLGEGLDTAYEAKRAERAVRQHALPPLVVESLAAHSLAEALRQWMPLPASASQPAST